MRAEVFSGSRRSVQARSGPRRRLIRPYPEHALRRLDFVTGAPRTTKALASVASRKKIDTASLSTPRIPDGVIAQPSAPQFSSSQAVISA
jgi:hypothetical protein